MTGLDSAASLTGDMKFVPKLHLLLQCISESNGRRGRDLRLPPQWEQVGYYELLDLTTAAPKLRHKYLNITRDLPMNKFSGGHSELLEARIECNFSEHRASISTCMGPKVLQCSQLFYDVMTRGTALNDATRIASPMAPSRPQAGPETLPQARLEPPARASAPAMLAPRQVDPRAPPPPLLAEGFDADAADLCEGGAGRGEHRVHLANGRGAAFDGGCAQGGDRRRRGAEA